jgi:hypothetical protein
MRPRDWFSVGVRLFGLWVIYDGFGFLLGVLANRLEQLSPSVVRSLEPSRFSPIYGLVFAIGSMALGFILIAGAERLTRWAFNETSPEDAASAPE